MYIYHDNAVCFLTLLQVVLMHIIHIMCLLKYINGKPDFKCTHIIYTTNHDNSALHVVYTYIVL